MTAFLPQQEPFVSGLFRKGRLIWDQWHYKYDYTHVSPLAIAHRVPIEDEFSFKWLAMMSERLLDALANRAELELGEQATAVHTTKQKLLGELLKSGIGSIFAIKQLVSEHLKFHGRFGAPATAAKTLQEYAELFRTAASGQPLPAPLTLTTPALPDHATTLRADRQAAGGTAKPAGTSETTIVSVVELSPLTSDVTYGFWLVGRKSQGEGPQSNHVTHVAT